MKRTQTVPATAAPSLRLLPALLFSLLLFTAYRACEKIRPWAGTSGGPAHVNPQEPGGGIAVLSLQQAPRHVRQMVDYLRRARHLAPPRGYKGGRLFRNREGTLPRNRTYYEFDVHPARPGVSRGAERLVVDRQRQNFYYTTDHYRTFTQIK